MAAVDFTSDTGKKVLRRLQDEQVIWLTTVREDRTPQSSPVWFLLQDDRSVLIFSQPGAPKVRAIRHNGNVSLNMNSDAHGGNVAILNGHAALGDTSIALDTVAAFVDKYREGIKGLEMTPEQMAAEYSQSIVITLERLRGW